MSNPATTPRTAVDPRTALTRCAWAATAAATLWAAVRVDGWSASIVVFLLLPDVPLMAGGGAGLERGQLHPRAVPWYNATHHPLLAALAVGATAVLLRYGATLPVVAALAWLSHIALDRSLGYGLRDRDGYQRTTRHRMNAQSAAWQAQQLQSSARP